MPDLFEAVRKGDAETVFALLEARADPNMRDEDGVTLLHYAVFDGHADIASMLIEAGADINTRVQPDHSRMGRKTNWSVLQFAVEGGHIGCVQMLLDAGVELFSRDESGKNAIDHAIDQELDPEIAILLLRARWTERQKHYG